VTLTGIIKALIGICIFLLGILSLIGYASKHVGLYSWSGIGTPGMGLNTAIAFTLTGIGFILESLRGK